MSAPRSKNVTVGGREFVVRPLLVRVAEEIQGDTTPDGLAKLLKITAATLQRTAPDVTIEWLRDNGDVPELTDVMNALAEVSGGAPNKGEAVGP